MNTLKLLTLNLHCLEEEDIKLNQEIITDKIIKLDCDIVFLQEVAQTATKKIIKENIKVDNYGLQLQQSLKESNKDYYYYYEPIKHSFEKYDEGVAILSKVSLTNKVAKCISKSTDYYNWKKRLVLKLDLGKDISLYTTHLGWTDEYEVFEDQIDQMASLFDTNKLHIAAGDFNVQPHMKEYSHIISKGLVDLYYNNESKYQNDITHISRSKDHDGSVRIDYIFSSKRLKVLDRQILFKDKQVSDHLGVYLEIEVN